ncbi:MAG: hypothetical protein AAFQ45_12240 [Pseudomonadota bacterium]
MGLVRNMFGRALCAGLGAGFVAGAIPLFTFGPAGQQVRAMIEPRIEALAAALGVPDWVGLAIAGSFAIAGPMALVWLIAGPDVRRLRWFVLGALGYGAVWAFT